MIPRTHTTMPTGSLNLDELRAAVEAGNIPCLIPVLYQLTGDRRWLDAPYVPARTRGFEELNSGGLPEAIQAEIRSAAFEAISAWAAGTPVASLTPSDEELTALMSACMGEPVPADFAPMIAEQLGFRPFAPVDVSAVIRERAPDFRVAVIGAGISGLASAFALKKAGVPFIVFERMRRLAVRGGRTVILVRGSTFPPTFTPFRLPRKTGRSTLANETRSRTTCSRPPSVSTFVRRFGLAAKYHKCVGTRLRSNGA